MLIRDEILRNVHYKWAMVVYDIILQVIEHMVVLRITKEAQVFRNIFYGVFPGKIDIAARQSIQYDLPFEFLHHKLEVSVYMAIPKARWNINKVDHRELRFLCLICGSIIKSVVIGRECRITI